ncbi:MAG: sensor domain-containing diguanylate cyclase [Rhodocyclaceae bacterium]|nr:sensor domain-containing diguanylate cyclase [Rhodocyclaceae bacterium]
MPDILQFENLSLRQQLESLLHEARLNEDKMRRFDRLERRLIGARSLEALLRVLLVDYKAAFGIEFVTLALVDREYEVARILKEVGGGELPGGLLLLQTSELIEATFAQDRTTQLRAFDDGQHQPLFAAPSGAIASVALLPLMRADELIGSLNLGSAAPGRYETGSGTDFLDRLSAIVAICLESALTQERLKRVGLIDSLTGVQNRRYFDHRCLVEISQAVRHRQPLACMFLDIDRFKRINDSHGHPTGDDVLRDVAGVIQAQLRAGDTIARYGGEEFVVLLPQTAGNYAHEIAERIRAAVAATSFRSQTGAAVPVTVSIGLAMLPLGMAAGDASMYAARLIAAADKAVYQAKQGGRDRVVCDFVQAPARQGAWLHALQFCRHLRPWLSAALKKLAGPPQEFLGSLGGEPSEARLSGGAHIRLSSDSPR